MAPPDAQQARACSRAALWFLAVAPGPVVSTSRARHDHTFKDRQGSGGGNTGRQKRAGEKKRGVRAAVVDGRAAGGADQQGRFVWAVLGKHDLRERELRAQRGDTGSLPQSEG